MSEENNNNELDDFIDQEEYQKALAALESSKSIRLKENADKKKAEAKAKQEALSKARKAEIEKKVANSKIKNKFVARCVADPVIPIALFVALAAIVGLICYIVAPLVSTPAMKYTVDTFSTQYASTPIYTDSLSQFGFQIPEMQYAQAVESNSSVALTADPNAMSPVKHVDSNNLLCFAGNVQNTATSFGTAVQGTCRKSDKKITALRVIAEYSNSEEYYNFLLVYFGSYIQTVYPELTSEQAIDLAQEAIANFQNPSFVVRGDYAYRVSLETGAVNCFVLDILPQGLVKQG